MKYTSTALAYLLILYIVGIALNSFNLIDYKADVIIDIVEAIGICFLIGLFLSLIKISRDFAFLIGIILAYISSLVILYINSESRMVLVNLIIAVTLALIFTRNKNS